MNPTRPISPSATMSRPASACRRTVSATALLTRAAKAPSSTASPRALSCIIARRSSGRGNDPTWVVRVRSTLRFIASLPAGFLQGSAMRPLCASASNMRPAAVKMRIPPAGGDADIGAAWALFAQYAASLPFGLKYQNSPAELAGLPGAYAPPAGCLLLAMQGEAALGVVALKSLAVGIAEIKRLYVVPQARGSGLGNALLLRVIDEARERHYAQVRLDSHRASMAPAIALYPTLGFVEISPYGPDLGGAIVFFEKRLQE